MEHAHPFSMADTPQLIDRAQDPSLKGWGFAGQALPNIQGRMSNEDLSQHFALQQAAPADNLP
jgi:hypothetical protein